MGGNHHHLVVFLLLCFFTRCESWGWFSSSDSPSSGTPPGSETLRGSVAEFSMEGLNDRKGMKLVENAKEKIVRSNWCWQNAYKNAFAGCSEMLAVEEKRSRLAWHLSDCLQKDSSRPPFPRRNAKSSMAKCLKALDDDTHKVYLEFYLETNSLCHQLQAHAFKHETERLVTDLKNSAHYVEGKLDSLYDKSENILQDHKKIHDSLDSFNVHTQQISETVRDVEHHTNVLLRHSESLHEQNKEIAAPQLHLQEMQDHMKRNLKDGMAVLKESHNYLGQEIGKLRDESLKIQQEIIKVGDSFSEEMRSLHSKTEDIVDLAGISLHKQQQLLNGQSKALQDLNSEIQSKALEESRNTLQQLTDVGHRQHHEVLLRQQQLEALHDRLMSNTKSILAAQESFESKQASMFAVLDKIFALQNAMLVESRMIKALFIYSVSVVITFTYMLTSTKQTCNIRPWMYIGLCVAFLREVSIVRFTNANIEQQAWIISMVRSVSMVVASVQLLYAIFTYRFTG